MNQVLPMKPIPPSITTHTKEPFLWMHRGGAIEVWNRKKDAMPTHGPKGNPHGTKRKPKPIKKP